MLGSALASRFENPVFYSQDSQVSINYRCFVNDAFVFIFGIFLAIFCSEFLAKG
jgi:hypothetical protein